MTIFTDTDADACAGVAAVSAAATIIAAGAAAVAVGAVVGANDPSTSYTFMFLGSDNNGPAQAQYEMALGSQGAWFDCADAQSISVQIDGVFGASGNLVLQGTNDYAGVVELKDINGNSMAYTSAAIAEVGAIPRAIRPDVQGGDGTTALTVTILMRRWLT